MPKRLGRRQNYVSFAIITEGQGIWVSYSRPQMQAGRDVLTLRQHGKSVRSLYPCAAANQVPLGTVEPQAVRAIPRLSTIDGYPPSLGPRHSLRLRPDRVISLRIDRRLVGSPYQHPRTSAAKISTMADKTIAPTTVAPMILAGETGRDPTALPV